MYERRKTLLCDMLKEVVEMVSDDHNTGADRPVSDDDRSNKIAVLL